MPPSIWPSTASGLIAVPTSCAVPIQTTRVSPSSTSTSSDDAHRRARERDVRALARRLARLGVERARLRVAVDPLDVDLSPGARSRSSTGRAARELHRACRHPRHARRRRGAGRVDRRRLVRREHDVVRAELGARDLDDHVRHALADLGRRAVHLGAAVGAQRDARGAVVVEALRVADVLEPDREADAAADALAARRVARAARAAGSPRAAAARLGDRQLGGAADHVGDRKRSLDPLAGRQHVAGRERVPQPQLDRVELERVRELVHLRLGGEAGLHGAEPAHRTARRVVRVDARRLDAARSATAYGPHANEAAFDVTAVELEAYAPPSSRIRIRTRDELPVAVRAVLGPDLRGVAVHVADERLLAAVDHLHRTVRVQREQRAVDLHREVLAPAERAADAGEVDAHALRLAGRGTARPGRGRRGATASRRRCRRRPRRRAPRARTRGRGTPGPGSRARRRPRRRRRRRASGSP